jgi:hypothetical protein
METQTLPAYWTQPGVCLTTMWPNINILLPIFTLFQKKITIGMPGMQHVFKYYTEFEIPQPDYFESGVLKS